MPATTAIARNAPASLEPTVELWGENESYEIVNDVRVENPPMGAREIRIANRLKRFVDLFDPEERFGTAEIEVRFVLRESPRLERQPDFSYVTFARCPLDRPMPEGSWNIVPDWVVEVISPGNAAADLVERVQQYFDAGVRLIWVVYPTARQIHIHMSPSSIRVARFEETIDGGPVLPGFQLPLKSLFVFRPMESVVESNGNHGV